MRKRYTKGKKVVPNLVRTQTGRIGYEEGGYAMGYYNPRRPQNQNEDETDSRDQDKRGKGGKGNTPPPVDTGEEGRENPADKSPFSGTTEATASSKAQREREYRADESGKRMEKIATGEISLEDIGAKAETSKIGAATSEQLLDSTKDAYKVEETAEALDSENYKVSKKDEDLKEEVDTITDEELGQADPATTVTASKMQDVKQVEEDVNITAAQSEVSDEAKISEELGVTRVGKIDPSQVKVVEGSVAERVVGKISKTAFADAAKVAGISLPRVTRAKQQLTRAGVSSEAIQLLGNDPDTLEAELMNYSEKERGIIGGLPVEALVSTQMDTLFEGMKDGEIPLWAKPATDKIEAVLAQRGLSASTVGRDALTSTLVGEAFKIANANAQAIQASVSQDKSIEAQALLREAEFEQQTGLANAQNVFKMDMAQFSADQQTELSNSKFMQTISLTEASNEQQAVVQDALLASQANLAEADLTGKLRIENAKSFLAMDMANLSNEQQAVVLSAQQEQQRMLSNQSAINAAKQFNATSENQTNQFMANLAQNQSQFNASQLNSMEQFNKQALNVAEARRVGNEAEAAKLEAQLKTDVSKFNSQVEAQREEFNTRNETTIAQSNVAWRRQANTADTAAQNAINQQNAQNAFGLTASSMNFLWQELRDEADFNFRRWDNDQTRKTSIYTAALGNDTGASTESNWSSNLTAIGSLITGWLSND